MRPINSIHWKAHNRVLKLIYHFPPLVPDPILILSDHLI